VDTAAGTVSVVVSAVSVTVMDISEGECEGSAWTSSVVTAGISE